MNKIICFFCLFLCVLLCSNNVYAATSILNVTPQDNAVDVSLQPAINIVFTDEMPWCLTPPGSVEGISLYISSTEHCFDVPSTAIINTGCHPVIGGGDYGSLEFSLDDPMYRLHPDTVYTVTLSGVVDSNGESVDDFSWSFTTQANTPPGFIGAFPHKRIFGSISLDATGKVIDPDNDILTYQWVYKLRGTHRSEIKTGVVVNFADLIPGFYDFLLRVTDEYGDYAETEFVVFCDISLPGDFDGDGYVDGADLNTFAGYYGNQTK